MNWHDVETNWDEIGKKAKSNWKNLPEAAVSATQGNRAQLSTLLQRAYGYSENEADEQLEMWLSNLLGNTQDPLIHDPVLNEKLEENLDTPETIEEHDSVIGSPYHKGY